LSTLISHGISFGSNVFFNVSSLDISAILAEIFIYNELIASSNGFKMDKSFGYEYPFTNCPDLLKAYISITFICHVILLYFLFIYYSFLNVYVLIVIITNIWTYFNNSIL